MGPDFGWYHAEVALEPAAARGLHQMEQRVDPAPGKQAVINRVGRNLLGGRSIDRLDGSLKEIGHDGPDAVNTADADDVEELRGELWERSTDASARDYDGTAAPEEVRKLAHAVEVRLQS